MKKTPKYVIKAAQKDLDQQRQRRLMYSTIGIALSVAAGISVWTLQLWRYIV